MRSELISAPAGLVAVVAEAFDEGGRVATIVVGRQRITAGLDGSVDAAVLRTAVARGERVIAQREADGWVVLGALRTAATPGVDEADEFAIKAKRISVQAEHELCMTSGAASFVIRALGHVETIADSITARASSVHKIIGRVIRLN